MVYNIALPRDPPPIGVYKSRVRLNFAGFSQPLMAYFASAGSPPLAGEASWHAEVLVMLQGVASHRTPAGYGGGGGEGST